MYKAYIEPDLKTAHLRIYNTFNPFSGFMAPTYILKSAKPVDLDAIPAVLKVRACPYLSSTVFSALQAASATPSVDACSAQSRKTDLVASASKLPCSLLL